MAAGRPDRVQRLVREPLLHFALIGALLFGLEYARRSRPGPALDEIVVTDEARATLIDRFAQRTGRQPEATEIESLLAEHIEQEVLFREALALGLQRGDPIIRRRLIQRMEFLTEDLARVDEPDDSVLGEFLHQHSDRYLTPERVTAVHIFLRREHRAQLPSVRESLDAGAAPGTLGDPFLHGARFIRQSRVRLAGLLGQAFADAVMALPAGQWSEPLESSFGWHLVRVEQRFSPGVPELDEVRARVLGDWQRQARVEAGRALLDDMRARYRVTLPSEPSEQNATDREGRSE